MEVVWSGFVAKGNVLKKEGGVPYLLYGGDPLGI